MRSPKKSGYLAGLDGWRALSILGVLADHAYTFTFNGHNFRPMQEHGALGVYIFFSISGILICTRLLEEEDLVGRINLRGFYIRRVLRIQPAAIVYLLAVALVSLVGWFPQGWRYWFGALFLYRNFQINVFNATVSTQGFFTGHFWTLAVEEHFYLLLSLFLYFVMKRRALVLGIATLFFIVWPLVINHFFPARALLSQSRHTDLQLQYLLPAALLAVLLHRPRFHAWAQRRLHPFAVVGGTLALALLITVLRHWLGKAFAGAHPQLAGYALPMWYDVCLRLFPFWVAATVLQPASLFTRVLEFSWLRWLGRISYSLYLWHVLFFRGVWPLEVLQPRSPLLALTHGPWNLLASLACASASFYLLERPLMRLGHRLAPPATPGRSDMQAEPSLEARVL